MAKAGFLAKKSGFMMMETETSNGYGSDKGSTHRNAEGGFCGLGLQPFTTTTTTTTTCASYKSPVGMAAAACLRYPFTTAQWQELERQALIFKYMMASVPVPPDLLIPTTRNLSTSASPYPSLNRGWFTNGADAEPGRCKRTDGKKWRCSRDVAPDQKYCERHMHRSRPRSRKHVEVQTDITNGTSPSLSLPPPPSHSSPNSTTSRQLGFSAKPYPQPPLFLAKPDFKSLPLETMGSASPYKDSRCMNWLLKGENVPMLNQDLQQLLQGKANLYQQSYQETQNLNLFTDFTSTGFEGLGSQHQSDDCCLFMNPGLETLSDQRQMPRHFIDAWSQNSPKEGTNKSSSGKLSPSTLSLSMSSDNGVGEDMDQIQMGLGVIDSECDNNAGGSKSQPLSWMTPASWMGGPLGEVLQSSNSISQVGSRPVSPSNANKRSNHRRGGEINLMTDDWGGSRDTSPRGGGTAMSSPSGVLHKTLTSPSDSSGGNSPTYQAAARTEVLQWMNQNK